MTSEIYCPGNRIESVLDRLHPMTFSQLLIETDVDIEARVNQDFPVIGEPYRKGLIGIAQEEQRQYRETLDLMKKINDYRSGDDDIIDEDAFIAKLKTRLGNHVENCRNSTGSCHDRYYFWVEKKARDQARSVEIEEEDIPGFIKSIDRDYLNLSI